MSEVVQENQVEKQAGTLDYLILMGMIHPFLTALFGVVNPMVYQGARELVQMGQSELLTIAAVIALLANFGMQMYTYHDKGLTANMTTMVVKEALKTENKFFPMVVGYVTNTALQTFGTPSNYMNVINMIGSGEPTMLAWLSAQYISGLITTAAVTGLIYTGKLEPVANKLNDWRMRSKEFVSERIKKALLYLGNNRDTLSRYDE